MGGKEGNDDYLGKAEAGFEEGEGGSGGGIRGGGIGEME